MEQFNIIKKCNSEVVDEYLTSNDAIEALRELGEGFYIEFISAKHKRGCNE